MFNCSSFMIIMTVVACLGLVGFYPGEVLRRALLHWQGHGPGKFFGRSANFPHFDRIFLYIYYVWLFLVPLSFDPGTFNGQDPPLVLPWIGQHFNLPLLAAYSHVRGHELGNLNVTCVLKLNCEEGISTFAYM
ncbi:hypothetical protein Hanom_Chr05g00469251 [Helianthus anomalus]